jgi:hypothetical protein
LQAARVVGGEAQVPGRILVGVDADRDEVGATFDGRGSTGGPESLARRRALHAVFVEGVGRELDLTRVGAAREADALEVDGGFAGLPVSPDLAALRRRVGDELAVAEQAEVEDARRSPRRPRTLRRLSLRRLRRRSVAPPLRDFDADVDEFGPLPLLLDGEDSDLGLQPVQLRERADGAQLLSADEAREQARLVVVAHEEFERQRL